MLKVNAMLVFRLLFLMKDNIGHTLLTVELKLYLKSTRDVNLLSKLSIIFKEWRVIVLFVLLRSHKGKTI